MTAVADGLVGDALAVPGWRLSDDDVEVGMREVERLQRRLDARAVELAAQAQQRGLPRKHGCRDLRGWVQRVLPTASGSHANAIARRAEAFFGSRAAHDLAPTREAWVTGAITGAQADVIAATIEALLPPAVPVGTVDDTTLREGQALLLREARTLDPRRLARVATYLRHRLDPDADGRLARDEQRQEAARGLTFARTGSGMVHVEGLLTARCSAAVMTAVDAWSAPHPAQDGTLDPRTGAQRRHDALQRLAEQAVAQPGLLPSSHGSPYRVVVRVASETFAAALADEPVQGLLPAELPGGQVLSSEQLAEIACGAEAVAVLVDRVGNPLDVGDTQYPFPTKQRLAIAVRDEHCTYPGCSAPPAWCDVHHLTPFSRGGKTSVDNGALLCGRHHRHVHATGTTGRLVGGRVVWGTDPPGGAPPGNTRAIAAVDDLVRRWVARLRGSPT